MASARVAPIRSAAPQPAPEPAQNAIEAFHWLTCKATAEIPVPRFTVADLMNLRKGAVLQTATASTQDIPLYINKIPVGRGQFEVVEKRLVLRLTELA
jgi:flagellar motor switch/type III secretory pathway protein FliN